jgi:hypothetical protein
LIDLERLFDLWIENYSALTIRHDDVFLRNRSIL